MTLPHERHGSLEDVAIFVAIARAGGLAEAATGLPRSALSRRLAKLERRLGAQLAKRSPQSFALTPAGETLYAECAIGLERIAAAEAAIRHGQERASGLVRVTATTPLTHCLLTLELPGFLASHPEIWVVVNANGFKVDLAVETYDFALRVGDVKGEGQIARRLFEECEALYAIAARAAAEAGIGVASLPRFVGEASEAAGRLVRILPAWTSPTRTIRAVLPHRPTAAARALLDFLSASAKARRT